MSDEKTTTLSKSLRGAARPDPAIILSFGAQQSPETLNAEGWQKFIDDYLVDWGARGLPDMEDDLRPPTRDVISGAIELAEEMAKAGNPPPSRVIPNGEGGLIFERYSYPNVYQALEILEDLTMELRTYQDSKLVRPE